MRDRRHEIAKSLNKRDEYYLLPLMLSLTLASSICLVFFLNELGIPQFEVEQYYRWDNQTYTAYRKQLLLYISATTILLALQLLSIRFKRRWLYLLLTTLNIVLFGYLPRLLDFGAST